MNTIRPHPRCAKPGVNAWASHSGDSTLTAWTRLHVAASMSAESQRVKGCRGVNQHVAAAAPPRVDASSVRSRRCDP
jgi:hypothetical protein